jgi:Mor family transcriptional regulator
MPQIIRDYDKGVSINLLAQKYKMSVHSIIKLVHHHKTKDLKCKDGKLS